MIEKLEQTYKSGTPLYETVIKINEMIDAFNLHVHRVPTDDIYFLVTGLPITDSILDQKTAPAGE